MKGKQAETAIPPLWRPRRDRATYVIAALVFLLELPAVALLALVALVTRAATATAGSLRHSKRGKIER